MAVVRARVEAKSHNGESNIKGMIVALRKACSREGVMKDYRRHETYESPGEKRRRKKRESKINVLKEKMRQAFSERKRDYE